MKRFCMIVLFLFLIISVLACQTTLTTTTTSQSPTSTSTTSTSSHPSSSTTNPSTTQTTVTTSPQQWDGQFIRYNASQIALFGSGTPAGTTNYHPSLQEVAIWNIDASLDNYGGIQTPTMALDFSKAVIFQMNVVSVYSQYIVKLAVAGEAEYYYVLSDDSRTGLISINVVDSMLSQKYREKNTQPDPGYQSGWKYANQIKNCSFHILAKGPDGEKQTAELILKDIAVYNNQPPITSLSIQGPDLVNQQLTKLKNAPSIALQSTVNPISASQEVLWSSANERIAIVSETGVVTFVGVGQTTIRATSLFDQSKSAEIVVDVLSGYEQVGLLTARLEEFTYGASSIDVLAFMDLYYTTWGSQTKQGFSLPSQSALRFREKPHHLLIENFFSVNNSQHIAEANQQQLANKALTTLPLQGTTNATIYRNINGTLVKEVASSSLSVVYANYQSTWSKQGSYQEFGIVVWQDGTVKKYQIDVVATTQIAQFQASDFANANFFTIPDRTKQTLDPVIHALSPATVALDQNLAVIRQNKYPEAKYHFGGVVSNLMTSTPGNTVQIWLDVASLNQLNDFVKTMWEIKILYYLPNGTTVVSSNPLKIASGNVAGLQDIQFVPAYAHFRLYVVCNGSDIGQQFAGAEMKIRSMIIQEQDS